MKRLTILSIFLICLSVPTVGFSWIHVGKSGESLEELSALYYGTPKKEIIIRAANGFMHPDDGTVLLGERVEIPGITYHMVTEDEDWYSLAKKYLGSSKRAKFLAEINNQSFENPPSSGKIVKIPYQLLYIFAPKETLKGVTRMFMGKKFPPSWLQKYNLKKKKTWRRGDAILIPLVDVEYTDSIKKKIDHQKQDVVSKKDKDVQIQAVAQIANLRRDYLNGNYLNMIIACQKLLSEPKLTNPQKIGVYKYLAFAYVAFDETEMAKNIFTKALKLQPSMVLSPITVSPKIIKLFHEVQLKISSSDQAE